MTAPATGPYAGLGNHGNFELCSMTVMHNAILTAVECTRTPMLEWPRSPPSEPHDRQTSVRLATLKMMWRPVVSTGRSSLLRPCHRLLSPYSRHRRPIHRRRSRHHRLCGSHLPQSPHHHRHRPRVRHQIHSLLSRRLHPQRGCPRRLRLAQRTLTTIPASATARAAVSATARVGSRERSHGIWQPQPVSSLLEGPLGEPRDLDVGAQFTAYPRATSPCPRQDD